LTQISLNPIQKQSNNTPAKASFMSNLIVLINGVRYVPLDHLVELVDPKHKPVAKVIATAIEMYNAEEAWSKASSGHGSPDTVYDRAAAKHKKSVLALRRLHSDCRPKEKYDQAKVHPLDD
jgi:hypothetical protein